MGDSNVEFVATGDAGVALRVCVSKRQECDLCVLDTLVKELVTRGLPWSCGLRDDG